MQPGPEERKRFRVIFSLGAHNEEKDAEIIESLVKKHAPDFYATELPRFGEEKDIAKKGLRSVIETADKFIDIGKFERKEAETVDKYGLKPVFSEAFEFADRDGLIKLLEPRRNELELIRSAVKNFATGKWKEAVDTYRTMVEKKAARLKAKEENLFNAITALAEKHPGKAVLVRFGWAHTLPSIRLKRVKNIEVKRVFDSYPQVYGYDDEALRRAIHGKEVTDELAAKALAEILIGGNIPYKNVRHATRIACSRIMLEKFALEDFKRVSSEAQGSSMLMHAALAKTVEAKGKPFPRDEKELAALVKKHYPRFRFIE
ncbi:MAG: hypothetical protein NTY90_05765 [Candidatus Micrarchaeota archaeon]|nr:hypothetical protein [Candidatus Micrarchaeota archaeon]